MKIYTESSGLFVKNDDNYIYRVKDLQLYDGHDYMNVHLSLVCGWDYINPDTSDVQGYCPADRFVDDVQDMYENCYFTKESLTTCLEENGYEVLDTKESMEKFKNFL